MLLFVVSFLLKRLEGWQLYDQKKIIVYNISKYKAVEFIDENNFYFTGDNAVMNDPSLYSYNLKPGNIKFHLSPSDTLQNLFSKNNFYKFYDSKILMIDSSFKDVAALNKIKLDYILISKNAKIKIADLLTNFDCNNFIFDASNSTWKIDQWKKECEELHLHSHSVPEQGALVINL